MQHHLEKEKPALIDKLWFFDKIRLSSVGSLRGLAKKMNLHAASLSLLFSGRRKMQFSEARQIADILDITLSEVLIHAGIEITESLTGSYKVIGYIDEAGFFNAVQEAESVEGPGGLPKDTSAIRCKSGRSFVDGWMIYASPLSMEKSAGRYCLVFPKKEKPCLAHVSRGYKNSTYNIMRGFFGPMTPIENVEIDRVLGVVWIRP